MSWVIHFAEEGYRFHVEEFLSQLLLYGHSQGSRIRQPQSDFSTQSQPHS